MNEQQRHEMILEKTYPTGADEWYCPSCGRRMLINWEPEFKRTLLEVGEDAAIHSASKGGLQMGSLQIDSTDIPVTENDPELYEKDPRMAPWLAWLEKVNFEGLWDDEG